MISQVLVCISVVASLAFQADAEATCWYPDGSTSEPKHSPCNTTVTSSACCDPLDSCSTSGLCLGRTGNAYRGSCTDKTWTAEACPSGCHAGMSHLFFIRINTDSTLDPFNKVPYSTFTPLWPCDPPGDLCEFRILTLCLLYTNQS